MANKMTKRDYFNTLLGLDEVQKNASLVAFINHELELLAKKNSSEKKPTKTQEENEVIKTAILDGMEDNRMYTVTEIQKEISECADLSNQKVSQLMRQLVKEDLVARFEEKRKAYFQKVAEEVEGD